MNGPGMVTLAGNTRPEAIAANDRGEVADTLAMDHMLMQFKRGPLQEREMGIFLDSLHDAKSANYHKWLTAEQFGERFGMPQVDIDRVTAWLTSNGSR
jgi:hypothetical protein